MKDSAAVPTVSLHTNDWFNRLLIGIMIGSVAVLMVSLLAWQAPLSTEIELAVGEVAPYDIVSPIQIKYESRLLTDDAKERAALAVPEQYDSTEGRVRRQQISRAREILDFINIVRKDPYVTPETQIDYLLAITDLALSPDLAFRLQQLDDAEWAIVVEETPLALDRVMRDEIRENTLANARRRVPSLINSDLTEELTVITAELVRPLIHPNSILNETRTAELREAARAAVPVQYQPLARDEIIIRAGDLVNEDDVEALTQLGLLHEKWNWWLLIRAMIMTFLIMTMVIAALYRLHPKTMSSNQEISLLAVVTVIWLLSAKFMIVPHDWLPYLYPLAAMSMMITVLIDVRVAIIFTIGFTLIIHFLDSHSLALATYTSLGSLLGAIVLGRAERLSSFLWAGLVITISNLLTFEAARTNPLDWETLQTAPQIAPIYVVIMLNGGLSASIALIGYFIFGNLFNITTTLQLAELSRPTHPLLRQLLLKASGTYHHTIVVSNLAERAAAAIGADALLARVGAYYHDIGKTVRPYFFAENISDGSSPHAKLDPQTSAQIIISHVTDGMDLAQKYHLPIRLRDFIVEHHGRSLTQYFYVQAKQLANKGETVNAEDFRYPGPNPRSKETAILLLADTCEAAVRAIRPASREGLEALVYKLIDERVNDGVLDECDLTFKDLQTIKGVFLQVLQGVHHPRIVYPESVQPPLASLSTSVEQPILSGIQVVTPAINGHVAWNGGEEIEMAVSALTGE